MLKNLTKKLRENLHLLAMASFRLNGMLRHAFGGVIMFHSLQHFISPALFQLEITAYLP